MNRKGNRNVHNSNTPSPVTEYCIDGTNEDNIIQMSNEESFGNYSFIILKDKKRGNSNTNYTMLENEPYIEEKIGCSHTLRSCRICV